MGFEFGGRGRRLQKGIDNMDCCKECAGRFHLMGMIIFVWTTGSFEMASCMVMPPRNGRIQQVLLVYMRMVNEMV